MFKLPRTHHPSRLLADFLGSELPWWMFYDMGVIYYGVLHLLFSALTRCCWLRCSRDSRDSRRDTCSRGILLVDRVQSRYEHEPTGRGTSLGRWHIGCTSFEQWVTTSISSPSVADPEGSPAQKDLVRPRPASRARHRARCTAHSTLLVNFTSLTHFSALRPQRVDLARKVSRSESSQDRMAISYKVSSVEY